MRDGYAPLTDIIGGGKYNLLAGQWTDEYVLITPTTTTLWDRGIYYTTHGIAVIYHSARAWHCA